MRRYAVSASAAPERDSETFRQLVEKRITPEKYVETLERRVRERHEDERNGRKEEAESSED
jgi:uncharacterized protein YutE (UPF0331/DUF86 family)